MTKRKQKRTWKAFCGWLLEAMGLKNTKATIQYECYTHKSDDLDDPYYGFRIVRIDICKRKPYHVSVALPDQPQYCTKEMAEDISDMCVHVLYKAIEQNSPMFFISYAVLP